MLEKYLARKTKRNRDAIINHLSEWVRSAVIKVLHAYGMRDVPADEYMGDGVLGLIQAYQRFDPTKNVAFKTFAFLRVRGEVISGIRRDTRNSLRPGNKRAFIISLEDIEDENDITRMY